MCLVPLDTRCRISNVGATLLCFMSWYTSIMLQNKQEPGALVLVEAFRDSLGWLVFMMFGSSIPTRIIIINCQRFEMVAIIDDN